MAVRFDYDDMVGILRGVTHGELFPNTGIRGAGPVGGTLYVDALVLSSGIPRRVSSSRGEDAAFGRFRVRWADWRSRWFRSDARGKPWDGHMSVGAVLPDPGSAVLGPVAPRVCHEVVSGTWDLGSPDGSLIVRMADRWAEAWWDVRGAYEPGAGLALVVPVAWIAEDPAVRDFILAEGHQLYSIPEVVDLDCAPRVRVLDLGSPGSFPTAVDAVPFDDAVLRGQARGGGSGVLVLARTRPVARDPDASVDAVARARAALWGGAR